MLRKFYDNTNQVKLVVPAASTSTIMSSLAAEIYNYVSRFFPKNYIKSTIFDTAIPKAFHNANKRFNKDLDKARLPSMVITPEYVQDGGNVAPMSAWGAISSRHDLKRDLNSNYYPILIDPDNKFSLYYDCDYLTMNFNFKITVKSWIQNVEIVRMLKNGLMPGVLFNMNQCMLKTEIPKYFVRTIADIMDYDLNDTEDMFDFQVYLKQASKRTYSIEKSVNMTTGKIGFFMIDPTTAKIYVDDIEAPTSVIRDNQTEGEYVISFRVQASVLAANNFILAIDRSIYESEEKSGAYSSSEDTSAQDNSVVTLTINDIVQQKETINFIDSFNNKHIGQIIGKEVLSYDIVDTDRSIYMSKLIDSEITSAHAYMKANNMDTASLLHFIVIGRLNNNNKVLSINSETITRKLKSDGITLETKEEAIARYKEEGYAIIYYDTMMIDMPSTNTEFLIYSYVDRAVYESALIAKENDNNIYGDNFLTVAYVTVQNDDGTTETKPVIIKSFKNAYEMDSSDLTKSVRISTEYGIGYFYLVPEGSPLSTDLKVCVGYTNSGLPIIYTFVYYKAEEA